MKKNFIFIVCVLLVSNIGAQVKGGVQDKLAKYYVNEEWEDCAFKAERMLLQSKYENNAEVILYLAASYNKIFLLCLEKPELLEKYPVYLDSYNIALKAGVNAKKKDKKAKVFFPANDFILEEIAISGFHYIDNYVRVAKKIPKANSMVRKIMKTYNDDNIYFLHGVLANMSGDTVTGMKIINETFNKLDSLPRTKANTDFIMIEAFDFYINFLLNKEVPLRDSAVNFADKGLQYFPDNNVLAYYKEIAENPDSKVQKPENEDKKIALKNAAIFIPSDDESSSDEEDIEEDDE